MNDFYKYKMEKNKIYERTLFSKKWKEINKSYYLDLIDKNNQVIIKTLNFNLFKYLDYKYEVDFNKGVSTFNQPIKCKIIEWNDNLVETMDGNFCGDLSILLEVRSINNDILLSKPYYKMFIKINKRISKKLIEMLFERAFSGTFESPWLEEEIYKEMQECDLIPKTANLSYCCDTCGKKYSNLKELLAHLIDDNHYDKILYKYRNFPELKNINDRLKLEMSKKGDN